MVVRMQKLPREERNRAVVRVDRHSRKRDQTIASRSLPTGVSLPQDLRLTQGL